MHLMKSSCTRFCALSLFVLATSSCSGIRDGAPSVSFQQWDQIPDAIPDEVTPSAYGNPESYQVNGKEYYVLKSADGFSQKGYASWYGTKFHGRRTSSGEIYDMFAMTAAHKTLPIPVYVEVTNLENGRRIVVKVNDRGPFHDDRIIDLSYAAATKLGISKKGTAQVKIRVVNERNIEELNDGDLYVQVGSYTQKQSAFGLIEKLREDEFMSVRIHVDASKGNLLYRVRIGPLPSKAVAQRVIAKLKANEYTEATIIN